MALQPDSCNRFMLWYKLLQRAVTHHQLSGSLCQLKVNAARQNKEECIDLFVRFKSKTDTDVSFNVSQRLEPFAAHRGPLRASPHDVVS